MFDDHEIPLAKLILPEEITRLYDVKSKVMVPSHSFYVDSLFHMKQSSVRQSHQTYWHHIFTTPISAVAILGVIYLSLRSPLRNLATRCLSPKTAHEPSTTEQNPSHLPPEPRRREHTLTNDNLQKDVAFTSYSIQPAN